MQRLPGDAGRRADVRFYRSFSCPTPIHDGVVVLVSGLFRLGIAAGESDKGDFVRAEFHGVQFP